MKIKKFQKNIGLLMIIIIISKLFGMFRDVVLANYYGTSNISDAYLIASSVPTLLFYFIGHALSTAYIPMYNKVKKDKGISAANKYTSNIINISLLICTGIIVLLLIFPTQIVKLFAVGFDNETAALASRFIRYSALSLYFMVLVNVGNGFLQINDNFIVPAAISIPQNLAIIATIVLSTTLGIMTMGWGILAAKILEFLLILPFIKMNEYKHSAVIDIQDQSVRETLYVVVPIIIGVGVSQINNAISKSIASTISEGAISALSYASIINTAVQEVLVTGVVTVLFADSAAHVANNEYEKVKHKLSKTIDGMMLLLIPASIGAIILAEPIVTVFFSRGNFNKQSIEMTSAALQLFSIGMVFISVRNSLIKVFYAYKDTKTPTITSVSVIIVNIILSLIFSKMLGVQGVALANSSVAIIHCLTLYFLLKHKIGDFNTIKTLKNSSKALIAGIIMGAIVYVMNHFIMPNNMVASIMVTVPLGMAVYALTVIALKSEPALDVCKRVKSILKK